jgi:hypothetical protein
MASREEEMQKLKDRYAQARGNKVEQPLEKKEIVKRTTAPKTSSKIPTIDFKPYIHIIKNDVRRIFGLKSLEEIKKENTYDPLMAAWKRGRNL